MNKGEIIQYDMPTSVYNKPATIFVAGFLGSPATNLVKTNLVEENEGLTLDATEFKYRLPKALVGHQKGKAAGSELFLGVRPEDLSISLVKDANSVFQSEVYVVEPLGPQNVVDLKLGSIMFKAVTAPTLRLDIGQQVWCGLDSNRIHIFDSPSGQVLI
jgi:multiple sugar transport system ATP-binding protein